MSGSGYQPRGGTPQVNPRIGTAVQAADFTRSNVVWAQVGNQSVTLTPQSVGSLFLFMWSATITITNSGFRGFFRAVADAAALETDSIVGWNVNSPVYCGFNILVAASGALAARTFLVECATGIAPAGNTTINLLCATDPNMYQAHLTVLEVLPPT